MESDGSEFSSSESDAEEQKDPNINQDLKSEDTEVKLGPDTEPIEMQEESKEIDEESEI